MFIDIMYADFGNSIRYLRKEVFVAVLGPKSYISSARMECGKKKVSLLIGNYCSIAHDVVFTVALNHDSLNVTTYPANLIGSIKEDNPDYIEIDRKRNFNSYQITIGNDVWVGRGARLMGGVKIGNGAIIGANAVVAKDVPPYAVVVGNPGKVIKYRFDKDVIEKLQRIKWWYWDETKIVKSKNLMIDPKKFADEFYDSLLEKEIKNETSIYLKNLRQNSYKIFYFIPDFELEHEIWKKVILQYLERYAISNKVALILDVKNNSEYTDELETISRWIKEKGMQAPLLITNQSECSLSLDVLQNCDVFITTCAYESVQIIDYGYDYGVEIISGLDDIIFE